VLKHDGTFGVVQVLIQADAGSGLAQNARQSRIGMPRRDSAESTGAIWWNAATHLAGRA
jgi:hypothetical protein